MSAPDGRLGVGVVGLSARRGWAAAAHLPALAMVPDLELRALATSRPESAATAAETFAVPGHGDYRDLVVRDDVDLVVVAVKVPYHRQIVDAAIAAGKHVLCEWPLGRTLEETQELTAAAADAGVLGFTGLQGRCAPAIRHVRRIVASGALGEVMSTTLIGSAGKWGATIDSDSHYLLDERNGATMLTIQFGHAAEAVAWTLGEFASVQATCATRRPEVSDAVTGERVPVTGADQVAATGTLDRGAVFSIHVRGGLSAGEGLLWEISGSEADLVIRAATPGLMAGNLQFGDVVISMGAPGESLTRLQTPAELRGTPAGQPAVSEAIAEGYRLIADRILGRPVPAGALPTFEDALARHRMLEAVKRSARDGVRVRLDQTAS